MLGKRPEVTVVVIDDLPAARWHIGGQALSAASAPTAWLQIDITAGTNTAEQKAAFVAEALAELQRQLGAGRPLAEASLICPVDGAISQFGPIAKDQVFQAKGHTYSTTALVGGDAAAAARFDNGHFATLYLSPRDYHRIHMPCAGELTRMVHVPGDLFSVNPTTARGVPGLFARNERVVCFFESAQGPFVLVLVGATIVGSMATVWHGQVNPPRTGVLRQWDYAKGQVNLQQGEEMGRFLLGSTVVMLFPQGPLQFNPQWSPTRPIQLGEAMAQRSGG